MCHFFYIQTFWKSGQLYFTLLYYFAANMFSFSWVKVLNAGLLLPKKYFCIAAEALQQAKQGIPWGPELRRVQHLNYNHNLCVCPCRQAGRLRDRQVYLDY